MPLLPVGGVLPQGTHCELFASMHRNVPINYMRMSYYLLCPDI